MNDPIGEVFRYWWLIFLLPVFGGIIRSTFGGWGKRRRGIDRRRGDFDLAGQDPAGQDPSVKGPVDAGQAQFSAQQIRAEEVARLLADHDVVNARWLGYELDVGKLIDYPMMSDVREPLTVEFLRAKRLADGLRPERAEAFASDGQLSEYRQALRNFEVSFDVAEREAKRIKDAHYSEPERQRLSTARKLLTMAVDDASTQAERQLAYGRARKELDGLLVLPDEAVAALELRVQAQISPVLNLPVPNLPVPNPLLPNHNGAPETEPALKPMPRTGNAG